MIAISDELREDLRKAAEWRACGLAWDYVASHLGRQPGTCSRWPSRYPGIWLRLFRQAVRRLELEAAVEARTTLRAMLRTEDSKTRLHAAEQLIRLSARRPARSRPAAARPDPALSAYIREVQEYSDEELEAALTELAAHPVPRTTVAAGPSRSQ